jgi:hypothetical protein
LLPSSLSTIILSYFESLCALEYNSMQMQYEGRQQVQAVELQSSCETPSARKGGIGEPEDNLEQEKKQELIAKEIGNEKANGHIEPEHPSQGQEEQQLPEPPFSIFTSSERRFIVVMASLAALFSPLSANIYYPALNALSEDLHESLSNINLTITTYLVRLLSTSVGTRAQCATDFPRSSTNLHW